MVYGKYVCIFTNTIIYISRANIPIYELKTSQIAVDWQLEYTMGRSLDSHKRHAIFHMTFRLFQKQCS